MDTFTTIRDWILSNKEWLFDGLGVVLLTGLGTLITKLFKNQKYKDDITQSQSGGDNSINFQVGRNLNINAEKEETDARKKKSNRW